jgi:hypothetical protein
MTDQQVNAPDRGIRWLTAAAVLVVASIAAVVSFIHIEHLAVANGQNTLSALLLPISVDGTVAVASLAMLWAARAGVVPAPRLARVMLVLGVTATLAANADYGAAHGVTGELLSGWPAIAFVGSVEIAFSMVRRTRVPVPGYPYPGPCSQPYLSLRRYPYPRWYQPRLYPPHPYP